MTPEVLEREFERVYGAGGVQLVLRHVLIAKGVIQGGAGKRIVRSDAEAKARAESVLRELRDGLAFEQAVRQYSDDPYTASAGGRLLDYRADGPGGRGSFGPAFDGAVRRLSLEQPLSGTVSSSRGFHIVELLERKVTKFADVKDALEKDVREKAATLEEKHALYDRLRKAAKIEGL